MSGDPSRSAIATAINSLAGPASANSTIEPQRLFPKRSSIDDANTLTSGVQLQYYTAAQKALADANRVIIMLKPGRRAGQSSASLPDGTVLVQASRQPFLEAARFLLNLGYPPETWIEGWRSGATEFALRARLGTAAGLTVDETKTVFAKWKPFLSSAVASPVRYSDGAATSLAESGKTISAETVDDPDPPDKRQRPRSGNASAGT